MTLVQLRHLVALAESGSFSRAAERVHLTQPALSRSIQSLEEELGGSLFDRIGRRAELTAVGREILERARQLVLDAQDLNERARAAARSAARAARTSALVRFDAATASVISLSGGKPEWAMNSAMVQKGTARSA